MDPTASLQEAVRLLDAASQRDPSDPPAFQDLDVGPAPERVAAVDGSSTVLVDNGPVWVVAHRAVAVSWPGPPPLPVEPEVVAVFPDDAEEELARRAAARGLEGVPVHSAEAFAEALRDLAELDAAQQVLETRPDLLLLDGALERLPRAAQERMDRILATATRLGVPVAGVAKRSRLRLDGVPLVPYLRRAARAERPGSRWQVQVPGYGLARVANLHPAAPLPFRVDAAPGIMERIVPLCRDAVYLGYPYPLAVAHNAVALTAGQGIELRNRLAAAVRASAGPDACRLLEDFHAVLDRNVPG